MKSSLEDFSIRQARQTDADAFAEICLKTANSGQDATDLYSHPTLPAYVWVLPYLHLEPSFAFTLAHQDQVIGYIVAAPDTRLFNEHLNATWRPSIREKLEGFNPTRPLDHKAWNEITSTAHNDDGVYDKYPAHLHINILPQAQSTGWGRKLIETLLDTLKEHGIKGVHLGVSPDNERAKGFYRRLGFDDISHDGRVIFAMALGS